MQHLSPHLFEDYNRTLKQLPNDPFGRDQISYQEVIKAHYLICDYFESETGHRSFHGIKDLNMLCSAVCRQKTEFGGVQKWNGKYEVMATLFFGLVRNHAFHDGNKRTAVLVLLFHLYKNNRLLQCRQRELERMTVSVAEGKWQHFDIFAKLKKKGKVDADAAVLSIADFLKRESKQLNKQYRPVTFVQFEAAIKQFGFKFDNPSGNFVDIVKAQTKRSFPLGRKKTEFKKVCQIGFPGYKRGMGIETIKDTLKKLGLTPENGFDKDVLFGDSDPLFQLIHDYEGPLKRLQDK